MKWIFVVFIFLPFNGFSQFLDGPFVAKDTTQLMKELPKYKQALLSANPQQIAAYCHPNVIKMFGSDSLFLVTIQKGMDELKERNMVLKDIYFGKIDQVYLTNKVLQVVIPLTFNYEFPEGFMDKESNAIATSDDNGKTWKFMDCTDMTLQQVLYINNLLNNSIKLLGVTNRLK